MTQKIRIEMVANGRGSVFIDDVEVKKVKSIQFNASPDEVNVLRIELMPSHLEIMGPADVIQSGTVEGTERE